MRRGKRMRVKNASSQELVCQNLIIYWTFRLVFFVMKLKDVIIDSFALEKASELIKLTFKDYIFIEKVERDEEKISFDKLKLLKDASSILENLKQKAWDIEPEFVENLKALQKIFGLSEAEITFFAFVTLVEHIEEFEALFDTFKSVTMSQYVDILSTTLEIPKDEFYKVLSYDSTLFKVGLLEFERVGSSSIPDKIRVLPELVDELFLPHENPEEIFQSYIQKVEEVKLTKEDFFFVNRFDTLVAYLKNALKTQAKGINILLYGPPGTGKTELAKVLAMEAEAEFYEIAATNKRGEPLEEKERFACYRLAQFLLKRKKNSLLIFDEVDDILDIGARSYSFLARYKKGDTISKVWINRLLEKNEVPTIWIANFIGRADPAYLRRFDIVLKMDYLPRLARLRMLKSYFKNLKVSEDWLKKIAEIKYLSPAVIEKAAKVVSLSNTKDPEKEAEFIITSSLEALGFEITLKEEGQIKLPFLKDALNTDWDIQKLFSALKRSQKGRILFYGPPGTGKTELARKIAENLGKQLLLKRASDIISPFVGMTEIKIAYMFKEAKEEKAVLLLDEADTFLLSRKDAKYSWEVSMVNELLTQMEAFEGIFICATNFVDVLDEAVMRRFDLKVRFDYLTMEQAVKFFASLFGEKEAEKYRHELSKLFLTPGNFATVYRKLKLIEEDFSPESFIKALSEEAKFNVPSGRKTFGFV